MEPTFESSGILRYSHSPSYGFKLIVEADPEIARLARWFVPKSVGLMTPRYAPHVTVIRKEIPSLLNTWGRYEGGRIYFRYETYARNDERYWWLRVFSDELAEIRLKLGLLPYGRTTMSPDPDLRCCYHLTIGNTK